MEISKKIFEDISKTGYQVILLRDVGTCDCIKKDPECQAPFYNQFVKDDDILGMSSEIEIADPKCPKCFGVGKKLFPILTNKIRVATSSGGLSGESKNVEVQLIELLKDDFLNFYFPYNYNFVTMKDYIALVKLDNCNEVIYPIQYTDIFKISDITPYVDGQFKYYKVSGTKKKVV